MKISDLFAGLSRADPAFVVPLVEVAGEILEIARDPMRLAQLRRLSNGPRKVPQSGQEGSLGVMGVHRLVEPVGEMHAILAGQSGDVARPRVGVLHVED